MQNLITSVISLEDLAVAVRSGNACIPITKLTGGDARFPDPCFGSLVVEGDDFELRVRSYPLASQLAVMESLMLEKELRQSVAELHCVLDGHLSVVISHVVGGDSNRSMTHGTTGNYEFNSVAAVQEHRKNDIASEILMIAKVARSELHFKNLELTTTTECSLEGEIGNSWKIDSFGGDIPPYRYKIQQKDDDLLIVVKLLPDESSPSSEADKKFMDALILSLNWINGGHPYAYYSAHQRDGSLIENSVKPIQISPQCRALLVRPKFGAPEAEKVMECGTRFFSAETPLSKDLGLFLWQYRDATAEGAITLSMLLQSSTLLEGVVGLTLRHSMSLDEKAIDALRMPAAPPGPKRRSSAKEKLYHAGYHLGFDWDKELDAVFKTWKKVRDALAHGNLAELNRHNPNMILDSYRQVIQVFNAITLRLIGYKGQIKIDDGWYSVPD